MGAMKITHLGHSTIAVDAPEGRIVFDPGIAVDAAASLQGAAAVVLTHEHPDHCDVDAIKSSGLPVWGPKAAAELFGGTVVKTGDTITVLGLDMQVIGGIHHKIHDKIPRPENVGFFFNGVLHPGDQFITEIPAPVKLLFVPIAGPWARSTEAADYALSVGAERVVPIHDGVLSEFGKNFTDGVLRDKIGVPGYTRLQAGESIEV